MKNTITLKNEKGVLMKNFSLFAVLTLLFLLSFVFGEENMKIKITVGNITMSAVLYEGETSRALAAKLPFTVRMMDLYEREMCYHFPQALPVDNVQTTGYEVGEIIYWPPRHSLVIMYAQNGGRFGMQKIGRIDSGVEVFKNTGDINVTFDLDE
jgi:hypothetical protein